MAALLRLRIWEGTLPVRDGWLLPRDTEELPSERPPKVDDEEREPEKDDDELLRVLLLTLGELMLELLRLPE